MRFIFLHWNTPLKIVGVNDSFVSWPNRHNPNILWDRERFHGLFPERKKKSLKKMPSTFPIAKWRLAHIWVICKVCTQFTLPSMLGAGHFLNSWGHGGRLLPGGSRISIFISHSSNSSWYNWETDDTTHPPVKQTAASCYESSHWSSEEGGAITQLMFVWFC